MANFSLVESFRARRAVKTPQISNFSVEREDSAIAYKTRINWKYNKENIIGFRIWRATSQKVLLRRNYIISQATLERTSGLRSFAIENATLFNKSAFSQNSMVRFSPEIAISDLPLTLTGSEFTGSDTRFDKTDEDDNLNIRRYTEIGFVKKNKNGIYEFVDKRVKFGETYFYVISSLSEQLFESPKSKPVTVQIEDLEHPDAPIDVRLSALPSAILVTISTNTKADDVKAFDIIRQEKGKDELQKIGQINTEGNFVSFLDFDVIPTRTYNYKIYSVDLFDNVSLWSEKHQITYDAGFEIRGEIPFPEVNIEIDSGEVILRGIKNHPDVVGHRFERRDVWRFQPNFEIKDYLKTTWPNTNFVDEELNYSELIDRTVVSGNIYQYRVTSIKKNAKDASYILTPHIRIQDGFTFSNIPEEISADETTFTSFNSTILNSKQSPIFVKFEWQIEGPWSHLIINVKDEQLDVDENEINIKIDNIPERNHVFYSGIEKGVSYLVTAKIFDFEGNILIESTEETTSRILA